LLVLTFSKSQQAWSKLHYELLDGTTGVENFDFAMLIPPFTGVD